MCIIESLTGFRWKNKTLCEIIAGNEKIQNIENFISGMVAHHTTSVGSYCFPWVVGSGPTAIWNRGTWLFRISDFHDKLAPPWCSLVMDMQNPEKSSHTVPNRIGTTAYQLGEAVGTHRSGVVSHHPGYKNFNILKFFISSKKFT